jgi:hypothetical protein
MIATMNARIEGLAFSGSFLRLEPELDQAADGFGATGVMILAPRINLLGQSRRKADGTDRIDASGFFGAAARFLVYGN